MNKKIFSAFTGITTCIIISCNNAPKVDTKYVSPAIMSKDTAHAKYKLTDVDNKIDPSCMMPLMAGDIGDTAHYKGHVLGFCSTECKKDFYKDPEANLKLAQLKK
jgi:YHS domain-containing protein